MTREQLHQALDALLDRYEPKLEGLVSLFVHTITFANETGDAYTAHRYGVDISELNDGSVEFEFGDVHTDVNR